MQRSTFTMKKLFFCLLGCLVTSNIMCLSSLNSNPSDPIKSKIYLDEENSTSSEIMELSGSGSVNNSISFILKSRSSELMLKEKNEKSSNQEINQNILVVGASDNETSSKSNEQYDNDEFDYFIRSKRDWEEEGNFSYLNESYINDTFSDEELLKSLWELITPKSWTWILIVLHTVVFVIGIIGNILVCIAVYRNHTMRTVTNYFIVNLAVADFLVILFCLPPTVVWDVTLTWFFGIAMCKIVLYFQSVSVTVSVLTLTFISIDRWYAICFPLKFKSTTGRAKTAIGIIWIVALACDIPEMIYVTTKPVVVEIDTVLLTQCAPTWSTETETIFVILKMVLFYLIPLLFMSIAYLQIIQVLWKSGNVPHQIIGKDVSGSRQVNTFAMNMNTSTEGQLRSRRKAAKMLVAVVLMFAFCYFPVHLYSILRTFGLKTNDGNRAFSLISHWLCYVNSAVNPIIYNFMSGKFRKEFHRAFEHCCQRSGGHGFQFNAVYRKTEKDSGIASRSHSRTDLEIQRVHDFEPRHTRKGTKTSILHVEA